AALDADEVDAETGPVGVDVLIPGALGPADVDVRTQPTALVEEVGAGIGRDPAHAAEVVRRRGSRRLDVRPFRLPREPGLEADREPAAHPGQLLLRSVRSVWSDRLHLHVEHAATEDDTRHADA